MPRATAWLLTLVVLAFCAACESTDASPDGATTSSVYVAVIRYLDLPTPADGDERPVVYVADMNAEPLDLEAQVEVIGALDPELDVRFVDDIGAAAVTDDGSVAAPDDGWLVAFGTPVEDVDAAAVTLRVEVSEPDGEPMAWQLGLEVGVEVSVVDAEGLETELLVPPVSS